MELPPVNKHGARMLPVAADTLRAEQDPKFSLSIGPIPRWPATGQRIPMEGRLTRQQLINTAKESDKKYESVGLNTD